MHQKLVANHIISKGASSILAEFKVTPGFKIKSYKCMGDYPKNREMGKPGERKLLFAVNYYCPVSFKNPPILPPVVEKKFFAAIRKFQQEQGMER